MPFSISDLMEPRGKALASPARTALRTRPEPDDDVGGVPGARRRVRLRDYFTLRPYGGRLTTPAVTVWLWSAWIVILLMATIEGFVWGAVGASIVPAASPWLAPPVAAFLFLLMFSIVWIVDSSLIMSERPSMRMRKRYASESRGIGPMLRWWLGIAARVGIVAISLYVTAPFIEKLIRADDIEGYHKDQVEQYFKQRDATIQSQVRARAEQLDAGLAGRIASLEQEIERLNQALGVEQEQRKRIEAEYAPEIEVLTRDLAAARARVGDEVLGRDGRPEGYGPEARKWDARADLIQGQLNEIQTERDGRLAQVNAAIAEQQQRLSERSEALQAVRLEQQGLMERLTDEVLAQQPAASPPKLTFAARSKALSALRSSPEEAGVPHFETVEGFAQAALGILFFALIALKLFEPAAVHAYYSEDTQYQYAKYMAGGLVGVPGFDHHDDPLRRLTPVEFYRLWDRYERDPDAYYEQINAVVSAESKVRRLLADQAYELELLERQRQDIDERLVLERRRREAELAARERELALELEDRKRRLDSRTDAEIEQLERQRTEARRAHDLEIAALEHSFAAERERLDAELTRKQLDWEQQRAVEEDELRRRQQAFDEAQRSAREDKRLRQMALDDRRRLRELELQQASVESHRQHDIQSRQQRIEQLRALLAEDRELLARQRSAASGLRVQVAERERAIAATRAELRKAEESLSECIARMTRVDERIQSADEAAEETEGQGRTLFGGPAKRALRQAEHQRRSLEREQAELAARVGDLHGTLANLEGQRDGLKRALDDVDSDVAAAGTRISRYRERLDGLLLSRG